MVLAVRPVRRSRLLLRALPLLLLIALSGCDHPSAPAPRDAAATCDAPASCCELGDASACVAAGQDRPDPERRKLLEKGCELGSAPACLRAAVLALGGSAAACEKLADRGCQLDPHASIPGTGGDALSCSFFDHEVVERAEALGTACTKGEPEACGRLGDLLRPYDAAASERAHARECSAGGLSGADQATCVSFLGFLASPPSCPKRALTLPNYGRCPSEAKSEPKHLGRLRVVASKDQGGKAVADAIGGSAAMRYCYAAGLVDQPKLAGRVSLSVLVDRHGRLRNVSHDGSALSDRYALECFVRQAAELSVGVAPPVEPHSVHVELELTP